MFIQIKNYYSIRKPAPISRKKTTKMEHFKKVLQTEKLTVEDIMKKVDTVEKFLVAKLEVEKIFKATAKSVIPKKVFRAIAYVLPDDHVDQLSPLEVDDVEYEKRDQGTSRSRSASRLHHLQGSGSALSSLQPVRTR